MSLAIYIMSGTDSKVPSAKCLYYLVGNITAQIDAM